MPADAASPAPLPILQPVVTPIFEQLMLGANALLFLCVNMYGFFVRILAERSQRKAFLQARNCIEDRLRLEDENEKQPQECQCSALVSPRFFALRAASADPPTSGSHTWTVVHYWGSAIPGAQCGSCTCPCCVNSARSP
ncbi:hypothetical protein CB1_000193001 [Camelus ferus]|nr:hypothetical protein CB1_000193001 [Camelus ferus]